MMRTRQAREWTIFGLAVGVMSMLVLTSHLSAQPPGDGLRFRGGGVGATFFGLRELDLSQSQRDQIRDIMEQARSDGEPRREQTRAARSALNDAVVTDAVNESLIRALAAELATLEADAAVARAHVNAAVLQVLTPDQWEELQAIQAERRARFAERRENRREERRGRRGER